MKKTLSMILAAAALATAGSFADASLMQAKLIVTPVNSPNNGVYNVQVWAKTDTFDAANDAGGIAGFQFDILSDGNAKSGPNAASGIGGSGKVLTTYSVGGGYTTLTPQRVDVGAPQGYPTDTDTDLDALGGSFSSADVSAPGINLKIGTGNTAAGNFDLIASETWTLTDPLQGDHLSLFVLGGQWWDANNSGNNFHTNFTSATTAGADLPAVPEPASLGLLGTAALGLVARRRKA